MSDSTHCPKCSNLKMYVDQQAQLITQLMKMNAATNERLSELEWQLKHLASDFKDLENPFAPTLPQPDEIKN